MNKGRFKEILSDPIGMSDYEKQELESMVSSYPYSQSLHIALAIKEKHDAEEGHRADKSIANASLYAADRRWFKLLLENGVPALPSFAAAESLTIVETIEEEPAGNTGSEGPQSDTPEYSEENEVLTQAEPANDDEPSQAHSEIEETLRRLKQARENAERTQSFDTSAPSRNETVEESGSEAPIPPTTGYSSDEAADTGSGSAFDEKPSPVHSEIEETLRRLKQARENAESAHDATYPAPASSGEATPETTGKAADMSGADNPDAVEESPEEEEITTYKSDSKDKRKEQMLLIDRFIETNPSISRADILKTSESDYEGRDLSPQHADITDNNLVSENLANILVKQGKIDRAIDIYKKLIWKFPQKKSYFASRIEELKSNG